MSEKLKLTTKILLIICLIGLSLLLYPSVSNYVNEKNATKAISTYVKQMSSVDEEACKEAWARAVAYNLELYENANQANRSREEKEKYSGVLNVMENGLMGFIEIPKLGVDLPIYHGTSNSVLQSAVGHLDWTSLPVGGVNSHCALSGHRGLPSARLFTDLDSLREGDLFLLNVLDTTLTYEVDQIRTVLPNDLRDLMISEGNDYCTLVTCTPYGINTHRLLVRGHRVENTRKGSTVISEAVLVDQLIVAFFLAVPLVFVLFMTVMLKKPKKKAAIISKEEPNL